MVVGSIGCWTTPAGAAQAGPAEAFEHRVVGGSDGSDGSSVATSNWEGDLLANGNEPSTHADPTPPQNWDVLDADRPRWTGRAGAVILQRGKLASEPLVINGVTYSSLLNASQFNSPTSGGVDLGLLRHGEYADIDMRYFGLSLQSATVGPSLAPGGVIVNVPGPWPSLGPVIPSANYSTRLDSFEMNLRRNVSTRWSILGGFRYVYFRDQFTLVGSPPIPQNNLIAYNGNNNLFGFQVGADGILWHNGNRFRIEGAAKAGLYGNAARNDVTFEFNNFSSVFTTVNKTQKNHAAFVGDVNLTGVYQLNDAWSLRAGYQLLWLAGVAVAADQVADSFANGAQAVNASGSAFFHGALVGLERSW